jgi:hypothetical protein
MKIDVTQQLLELDGTPMVTGKQICRTCGQGVSDKEPLTVRWAATKALTATFRDEPSLPGDEKVARFHLALKVTREDQLDLKAEDVVLIKQLVGKMYGPVVVGQVWSILDPDE